MTNLLYFLNGEVTPVYAHKGDLVNLNAEGFIYSLELKSWYLFEKNRANINLSGWYATDDENVPKEVRALLLLIR